MFYWRFRISESKFNHKFFFPSIDDIRKDSEKFSNILWRKKSKRLHVNNKAFRGDSQLPSNFRFVNTSMKLFCYFLTDKKMDMIVEETNRASVQENVITTFKTTITTFIRILIFNIHVCVSLSWEANGEKMHKIITKAKTIFAYWLSTSYSWIWQLYGWCESDGWSHRSPPYPSKNSCFNFKTFDVPKFCVSIRFQTLYFTRQTKIYEHSLHIRFPDFFGLFFLGKTIFLSTRKSVRKTNEMKSNWECLYIYRMT